MLIIVDKRISEPALRELSSWGKILLFESENITYKAISCHPDIFFCIVNQKLIVAPNCPEEFKNNLKANEIRFSEGITKVGMQYPESAHYNAVVTETHLIHNLTVTEKTILSTARNLMQTHVNQAYTRCNLVHLGGKNYITSDKGIEKVLVSSGLNVFYINPRQTILSGFEHGFFGGCCGFFDKKLFVNGSLDHLSEKTDLQTFCRNSDVEIIELSHEKLIDIGSILFL